MVAITVTQMNGVYRHVHFQHVQECLSPGLDDSWEHRSIVVWRTEIQDLESRMCLERIADCVPGFVAHPKVMPKIQFNKPFVFFEGVSDCKDLSVTDLIVVGNAGSQAFQRTISAQPIRENIIVHIAIIKLGRALIAS
jgi:hypothetical protein